MDRGITVIIPTVGRPTLLNTLFSIAPQLNAEDAVVVVFDGASYDTQKLVVGLAELFPTPDWTYVAEYGGAWGHSNRNYALDNHVRTSHVWTIDDDDIATPHALESLREHMDDPWTIFRMTFCEGHFAKGLTVWREQRVQAGDIGTPMIFAPLCEARFGIEYMGDARYAEGLQAELGDPVWSEDVVALIRPVAVEE